MGIYFKARKNENFVNFPRAKPKLLEIEICLLSQTIYVLPEKHYFLKVICEV